MQVHFLCGDQYPTIDSIKEKYKISRNKFFLGGKEMEI
jgi:hypothetical protein